LRRPSGQLLEIDNRSSQQGLDLHLSTTSELSTRHPVFVLGVGIDALADDSPATHEFATTRTQ